MRNTIIKLIIVAALAAVVSGAARASAHAAKNSPVCPSGQSSCDYYPKTWKADKSVEWKFVDDFPSTSHDRYPNFRERVREAGDTWNAQKQPMTFVKIEGDYAQFDPTTCPSYQKDGIHWNTIDGKGNTFARAHRCKSNSDASELFSVNIEFDYQEDWYDNLATPIPSDRADGKSVALHEFGHFTGFYGPFVSGHFDPNATICTTDPRQTMCPFINYGESYQRGLETHDIHTFDNAY